MKKLIAIAVLSLVIFTQRAYSQDNYISVQYSVGFGTGDLGEFISAPSFRGALIEYRKEINRNLHVGGDFGWNVFYERKDYATYTLGTESLSGIQYRYQNALPMLAAIDYNFSPDNQFKPYVGLGIGTVYTERATDMGMYRLEQNPWQFALRPEVGFRYEMSPGLHAKVAAKYYYGFPAGDLDEAQGFVSINVGLAFRL
jgi:outer membrane protein